MSSVRFDLETIAPMERFNFLTGTVVPRSIALVTSLDRDGNLNAAPYSFFGLISHDPPLIALGVLPHPDGRMKDTGQNIQATGEFVVNLVSEALAEAMNVTCIDAPPGTDELKLAKLDTAPSDKIRTPRVAASPVAFECVVHTSLSFGPNQVMVVGRIVQAHVSQTCVLDAEACSIDTPALNLIGSMHGARWYTRASDLFAMDRPGLHGKDLSSIISGHDTKGDCEIMPRALLIVLDSVGIGGAEDAHLYGDAGADTVGHIAEACAHGEGDRPGLRQGPLDLPNLAALGLGLAAQASTGRLPPNLAPHGAVAGAWGYGVETSKGKDTPSGHWEIAGVPVRFDWGYFPNAHPAFPPDLTQALIREAALPGILGDRHASGIAILDELGAEHVRTGRPICYTSVDSVFQIAAHEETFGLERLYDVCRIARRLCDPVNIGRVIARPFVGSPETGFTRTGHRKDFAAPPPADTILDNLTTSGRSIVTIGKIGDIFAHRGTGREVKAHGNDACLTAALNAFRTLPDGGLVFANLVDFDTEWGHRRDVPGYAAALEAFDRRIPEIRAALSPGDLAIVTADHGNDPTWRGTDHTREHTPILAFGPEVAPGPIGRRETFADIGAAVAGHLGVRRAGAGRSWV